MQWIVDVMSGRRRGASASLLRAALSTAEPLYTLGVNWRNRRFDRCGGERVDVPVFSVGNLTTGGTGKTPVVQWLCRQLREMDQRVAIVSRGYGAEAGAQNDEAMELELSLPDVPHLQNPDRVAASRVAIEELDCQCLVLDDGFQHRRLHRDLDIVLLDALQPFGFGHVLPRGLLREPLASLRRADWIGISRADQVSADVRQQIRSEVEKRVGQVSWFEVRHRPLHWLNSAGDQLELDALRDRPIVAFCGIGNPRAFQQTLADLSLDVRQTEIFPDHHPFGRADIEKLQRTVEELENAALVCTRKDLVKVGVPHIGPHAVWALQIGIEFLSGEDALLQAVRETVGE